MESGASERLMIPTPKETPRFRESAKWQEIRNGAFLLGRCKEKFCQETVESGASERLMIPTQIG